MVELMQNQGVLLINGTHAIPYKDWITAEDIKGMGHPIQGETSSLAREEALKKTISYGILLSHNQAKEQNNLKIRFDAMASHDITYVGIIQTARASGLTSFPVPYALTNCHNSLCAVGGTINEDDHIFGLSAARRYGGSFIPPHQAVIHQYVREQLAGCGRMILCSDSHTRYGALGTMGIGEGGPELVKQLLNQTYNIAMPKVVAVLLKGKVRPGVGPQDVALAIIRAVFKNGFVNNRIMEFVGPGIKNLSIDFRNGIDVMTTETTCLSTIWSTDEKVAAYFRMHGRPEEYKKLEPGEVAYYDSLISVDLAAVEPMIALPFHPSNAYTIRELKENLSDILRETEKTAQQQLENPALSYRLLDKIIDGKLKVEQGVIGGCAGGSFENIAWAADLLKNRSIGNGEFSLSFYPASQPILLELTRKGLVDNILKSGATMRTAFCGPCFGAGDVPSNGGLSIRHVTRNFPYREGSHPQDGQVASVALMDARSITATALSGGVLTGADELNFDIHRRKYNFVADVYKNRVYRGFGLPMADSELRFGPNIIDWPKMSALPENLLLQVAAVINDPVTTTDELIPSGETSSYRSNPLKLASFTLSRKDPGYVRRALEVKALEDKRLVFLEDGVMPEELAEAVKPWLTALIPGAKMDDFLRVTGLGSLVFARKPGDGSAREQAASSQRVLGGWANVADEYATKRYRSNLINWGMLPFQTEAGSGIKTTVGDMIFLPAVREEIKNSSDMLKASLLKKDGTVIPITLTVGRLNNEEREILLTGCLINYYARK
ncbi:MAG: hydratase [Syntrophales bacterium]|nr:hydratase [Syntrophales bacterium]